MENASLTLSTSEVCRLTIDERTKPSRRMTLTRRACAKMSRRSRPADCVATDFAPISVTYRPAITNRTKPVSNANGPGAHTPPFRMDSTCNGITAWHAKTMIATTDVAAKRVREPRTNGQNHQKRLRKGRSPPIAALALNAPFGTYGVSH